MADYQLVIEPLNVLGVSVYAVSADAEADARRTVEKFNVGYPVLYGLDAQATAELLGIPWEERRRILQPAAFILDPERRIQSFTVSTGPVGRLFAAEALRFIGNLRREINAKR